MASVHELEAARARQQQSASRPPKGPQDAPAPDRAAALNMLGTFDLDGVDVPSPDEVLAAFEGSAEASGPADPDPAQLEDQPRVAGAAAVHDVDSDEILRELEEHHRRGQTPARPSAPRGSAELQPRARRAATRVERRTVRKDTPAGSQRRRLERRPALIAAALAPLVIAATTLAIARVGGTHARTTGRTTSSSLHVASEIAPFISTKFFSAVTSPVAAEGWRLARHHTSPVAHSRRKRRATKSTASRHVIREAAASLAVSATPTNSAPSSSSSSSATASSTQSAGSESAPPATTHSTQPAFGLNGSLGPGRGAPGTQ